MHFGEKTSHCRITARELGAANIDGLMHLQPGYHGVNSGLEGVHLQVVVKSDMHSLQPS